MANTNIYTYRDIQFYPSWFSTDWFDFDFFFFLASMKNRFQHVNCASYDFFRNYRQLFVTFDGVFFLFFIFLLDYRAIIFNWLRWQLASLLLVVFVFVTPGLDSQLDVYHVVNILDIFERTSKLFPRIASDLISMKCLQSHGNYFVLSFMLCSVKKKIIQKYFLLKLNKFNFLSIRKWFIDL